jgi:Transposase, Mutator family
VLVARNLLASASAEIVALIEEVQALGVPIRGVVSDKQASLCLAIARTLPGVPHQLCQLHSLRDAALPVCEADRKLKKELRQKVRGVREVERKVVTQQTTAAAVVRDYCLAVRTGMRADGKSPLEPAGLCLWRRLQQLKASLVRGLEQRDDPQ